MAVLNQEELFREFMASKVEPTSEEFDQAFSEAAHLVEIKNRIAEMERSPDPIATACRQDKLAALEKELAGVTAQDKTLVLEKELADVTAQKETLVLEKELAVVTAQKETLAKIATIAACSENTVLSPGTSKQIPDEDRIVSTTPFNQAVEKLYRHCHERHEYDPIKPDYVNTFIQKMGDLLKKEDTPHPEDEMELIKYLAERIKNVKKAFRAWKITTQEIEVQTKRGQKIIVSSGSYAKEEVTKKLCLLRKKYPIPCTIPIP